MSEPTEMRRVVLTLAPDTANANPDPLTWDWSCILSGLIKHVQASGTWIHIAVWEHKDGSTNTRAFLTEAGVQKWKEQIAAEWWETEIPDEEMPDVPAEAADRYFELMGEVGGRNEYFTVSYENLED